MRSTAADEGLVAVLLEERGPGMIAVPVTPREGLALSAVANGLPPTWLKLLHRCVVAAEGDVEGVSVNVGPDGELLGSLELRACTGIMRQVSCTPGEAVAVASAAELRICVSDRLLAQQGVDLGEAPVHELMAKMRDQLERARVDDFLQ
ncbi:bifunctional nuclease domain-containing protein [Actinomyces bovis]|uniref:bifunctional nuclease domain-containing protein n=1 Tax=Actinomyces bovis TaxID=1658 RepID=UPI0015588166|nr:bifunctional nuclease domain-containing protein [Actinomyces bovis]